ncbi:MAG TPA: hypothetical protein VMV83_13265 [Rectinemataceae bacterium]|nr:hypothetical protein [Rectinemataceae bacterium]
MPMGIDGFFAAAREGLENLGAEQVNDALSYYEEFAAEALEAGKTEAEVLERLGKVEDLIANLRSEASISRAETAPGPGTLTRAAHGGMGRLAGAAGRASLVSAAALPYLLAMALYVLAFACLLGVFASVTAGILAYLDVSSAFPASKVGAAGIGIIGVSVFGLLAAVLRFSADALARFTLGLMRKGLGREGRTIQAPKPRRGGRGKALAFAAGGAFILGVALVVFSGIGTRYFSIWDSIRPAELATRSGEWKLSAIDSIAISTLNSDIAVVASSDHPGTVRAIYEEPDWMRGSFAIEGGRLEFSEVSNGRLPFLRLAAAHRGTTAIRLEVPIGWKPGRIEAVSVGGSVDLGPLGGGK